jgi:hypothetical protein
MPARDEAVEQDEPFAGQMLLDGQQRLTLQRSSVVKVLKLR